MRIYLYSCKYNVYRVLSSAVDVAQSYCGRWCRGRCQNRLSCTPRLSVRWKYFRTSSIICDFKKTDKKKKNYKSFFILLRWPIYRFVTLILYALHNPINARVISYNDYNLDMSEIIINLILNVQFRYIFTRIFFIIILFPSLGHCYNIHPIFSFTFPFSGFFF